MVRLKFIHLLNSYELLSLNLVLWGNGCVCKRIINWSDYMGLLIPPQLDVVTPLTDQDNFFLQNQ